MRRYHLLTSRPPKAITVHTEAEPCDDECPACADDDHGACERTCHAEVDLTAWFKTPVVYATH